MNFNPEAVTLVARSLVKYLLVAFTYFVLVNELALIRHPGVLPILFILLLLTALTPVNIIRKDK